jgi:hypothetical protein
MSNGEAYQGSADQSLAAHNGGVQRLLGDWKGDLINKKGNQVLAGR